MYRCIKMHFALFCFVLFCFQFVSWLNDIIRLWGIFCEQVGWHMHTVHCMKVVRSCKKKNKCCRKSGNKGSLRFSSTKSSFTVNPDSRYRNHIWELHTYCNKLLHLHTHVHCVSNLLCAWAVTAADKNSSVGLHVEIHCTLEYILHTWLWIECL